tara:strand:- start:3940 stop:4251 length:312 start_codon:yes stop_codon:yes gene_type:complete
MSSNNKKKKYDHSNPVFRDPLGGEKNYGTINEYNYEPDYGKDPPLPDKIPEETPKPDSCVICNIKTNKIYWSSNPEILELEKKYVFNWHCLNCIFTLSEKYNP